MPLLREGAGLMMPSVAAAAAGVAVLLSCLRSSCTNPELPL